MQSGQTGTSNLNIPLRRAFVNIFMKGGDKLPRQNQILGEMKTRGIRQREVCDMLLAQYHEHVHPTELCAILQGRRSETPKGQRVIGYVKSYLKKTQ